MILYPPPAPLPSGVGLYRERKGDNAERGKIAFCPPTSSSSLYTCTCAHTTRNTKGINLVVIYPPSLISLCILFSPPLPLQYLLKDFLWKCKRTMDSRLVTLSVVEAKINQESSPWGRQKQALRNPFPIMPHIPNVFAGRESSHLPRYVSLLRQKSSPPLNHAFLPLDLLLSVLPSHLSKLKCIL